MLSPHYDVTTNHENDNVIETAYFYIKLLQEKKNIQAIKNPAFPLLGDAIKLVAGGLEIFCFYSQTIKIGRFLFWEHYFISI